MICLVCGRKFEGSECEVCKFPVVEFPGDNIEEGMRSMQPTIISYRNNFLNKTIIGITIYHYKIDNGEIVAQEPEDISFGNLADLINNESWLDQSFDSVSKNPNVKINVFVLTESGFRNTLLVEMPNKQFEGQKTIKLGMSLKEDLSAVIIAKSENETSRTDSFFLF